MFAPALSAINSRAQRVCSSIGAKRCGNAQLVGLAADGLLPALGGLLALLLFLGGLLDMRAQINGAPADQVLAEGLSRIFLQRLIAGFSVAECRADFGVSLSKRGIREQAIG